MKKGLAVIGVFLLGITLVACSSKTDKTTKETNTSTTETTSSTTEVKTSIATFKGKVAETPVIDKDIVSLTFDKVEAINDPDDMIDGLNADGVILNASVDSFDKSLKPEEIAKGDEITFELETPTIMTSSLPPQIPGNSIKLISKTE